MNNNKDLHVNLVDHNNLNNDLNKLYNLSYNEIFYNAENNEYYQFKGCDGMYGLFLKSDTKDFSDIKFDPVKYKDNFIMISCNANLKILNLERISIKNNNNI